MTTPSEKYRLELSELYHGCELEEADFATTADLEPLSTTIGQDRALEAIEFGVSMPQASFNLYVMGSPGLGRHTLVREALQEHTDIATSPSDWCYVANYQRPQASQILQVPAGTARRLRTPVTGSR